ncbi:hypothetical protein HELRODRAFT_160348 [Helobdella robusta]|uniref:non-specific serine/threonine protein kinase n=1 Tax=Helobdella robusta TaxID=6412 RepID=T1EQ47_HELRO|nr:hypothetical protein HELRODRAFT_160348 [Helobdella robusta]ESO06193.1 hypothetical protein HELRODRAFT_160348 [Helobdella robusta]
MAHPKSSRSMVPLYINSMSQSRSFNEPQVIGQYRLIKTIGKGNFAKVKLARHFPTDRLVAIKIIDKTKLSTSSLDKTSLAWKHISIQAHRQTCKQTEQKYRASKPVWMLA